MCAVFKQLHLLPYNPLAAAAARFSLGAGASGTERNELGPADVFLLLASRVKVSWFFWASQRGSVFPCGVPLPTKGGPF